MVWGLADSYCARQTSDPDIQNPNSKVTLYKDSKPVLHIEKAPNGRIASQ